jgi:hypothetical protein
MLVSLMLDGNTGGVCAIIPQPYPGHIAKAIRRPYRPSPILPAHKRPRATGAQPDQIKPCRAQPQL